MAGFIRLKKNRPPAVSFDCEGVELLPGEIIVARATRAQLILTFQYKLSLAIEGTLVCTNYRVTFVPDKSVLSKMHHIDSGYFAASKDVPLGCVDRISVFANRSKKVLDGLATLPRKISQLELTCRDIRRLLFSVKQCEKTDISSVVSAIARHSHPGNVHLLFAFDYTLALKRTRGRETTPPPADSAIPSYLTARDWQRELQRLSVTNDQWRITEVNKKFLVSSSLCPYFVCPTNYSDSTLENTACYHANNRLPVWVWSHPHTGVSLTRAAALVVDETTEAPDPGYLRAVALARHAQYKANNKRVYQYNVSIKCGSLKNLSSGFSRLLDLCTPTSLSEGDKHWLAGLESSGWMETVRACLLASKEIANLLCIKQRCVMLLDETGRDLSCVVSSLVQIMVDPYFRSLSGFEMLVQKEWVAMGHPFTTRHKLTAQAPPVDDDQTQTGLDLSAPVFLLFLNCVWELSRQFPSAFEFSENFLLRFHDMTLQCLYNNFLFDSPKQRVQASIYSRKSSFFGDDDESMDTIESNYEGPIVSAWTNWRASLTKEENEECLNPLYYIFGSSDAHYDYNSTHPLQTEVTPPTSLLTISDRPVDLATAGNNGLYRDSRESSPGDLALDSKMRDYYQRGLLMPETSMCSMQFWSGYFFRYVPELSSQQRDTQSALQKLESRMVRNVRKMKDELNELELNVGSYTSDLTSIIGEVLQTREKELSQDKEMTVDQSLTAQPRLSAVVYSYEAQDEFVEVDGPCFEHSLSQDHLVENGNLSQNSLLNRPSLTLSLSQQKTTLAEFTDALYLSQREEEGTNLQSIKHHLSPSNSPLPPGRSPVIKTRLKVTKSKGSDPVIAAWQHSPQQSVKSSDDKFLFQKSRGEGIVHSFSEFSDV